MGYGAFQRSITLLYLRISMPISTLGGWHPDAHRAMGAIAVNIASRNLSSLHYARATLFHRHAALLVANNAVYLMSGFDSKV